MIIYHFVLPETWAKFEGKTSYEAESLAIEGFIHCSFENQIDTVLNRYFSATEKVIILRLESDFLTEKLVIEPSTNGELYPHIYGKINREAIVNVEERTLKSAA